MTAAVRRATTRLRAVVGIGLVGPQRLTPRAASADSARPANSNDKSGLGHSINYDEIDDDRRLTEEQHRATVDAELRNCCKFRTQTVLCMAGRTPRCGSAGL